MTFFLCSWLFLKSISNRKGFATWKKMSKFPSSFYFLMFIPLGPTESPHHGYMCEIRKQSLSVSPYSQHGHAVLISVLSTINKYSLGQIASNSSVISLNKDRLFPFCYLSASLSSVQKLPRISKGSSMISTLLLYLLRQESWRDMAHFQRNFSNKRWNQRFSMNPALNQKAPLIRTTHGFVQLTFSGGS